MVKLFLGPHVFRPTPTGPVYLSQHTPGKVLDRFTFYISPLIPCRTASVFRIRRPRELLVRGRGVLKIGSGRPS